MSLIQKITSRTFGDLINEGARAHYTGTLSSGADQVIIGVPATRIFVVTSYHFSSPSASAFLVSLGLNDGLTTTDIFQGYVGAGQVLDRVLSMADWVYGDLGCNVVVSTAGDVAYTISGRINMQLTPLGYIEQIGTKNHANPVFPPESGSARGLSEF
jgi:hypothetical protein